MKWNPKPSTKSADVESNIESLTGINRKDAIEKKVCPFCAEGVTLDSFKDALSLREFHISDLCQSCQDKTFG